MAVRCNESAILLTSSLKSREQHDNVSYKGCRYRCTHPPTRQGNEYHTSWFHIHMMNGRGNQAGTGRIMNRFWTWQRQRGAGKPAPVKA